MKITPRLFLSIFNIDRKNSKSGRLCCMFTECSYQHANMQLPTLLCWSSGFDYFPSYTGVYVYKTCMNIVISSPLKNSLTLTEGLQGRLRQKREDKKMVWFLKAKSTLKMPRQAQNIQARVHWESKVKRVSWLVRGLTGHNTNVSRGLQD